MIKYKGTFFLGVFIFLIPYLGLPTFWKTTLITICGILLVLSSIKISIPTKKISRTRIKKEKPIGVNMEGIYPPNPEESASETTINSDITRRSR